MNGHDVLGLDDVVAVQQLPRGGMSRDVYFRVPLVNHLGAEPCQIIDNPIDRALVTRNQTRGKHNSVAGSHLNTVVVAPGNSPKSSHRFALGSCHHVDALTARDAIHFRQRDHDVLSRVQIPQIRSNAHIPFH